MTTSGSTDFSLTARQIVQFALRKQRVLGRGETASGDQAADAVLELNLMLKGWQKYPSLWRLTEGSVTLLANDYDYTLSPAPHRVLSVRYYNGTTETPLADPLSREDYFNMPDRAIAGTPSQVYVDYQRSGPVMYVWRPLDTVAGEEIRYTYQRKFEDVDSLDNDLDVKQEWLEVVGYNLAYRMGPDYGRVGSESFAEIKQQALTLKEEMLDDDRDETVRFMPGYDYW